MDDYYVVDTKKDLLGEGAFGMVYAAVCRRTGEPRVIKVISKKKLFTYEKVKADGAPSRGGAGGEHASIQPEQMLVFAVFLEDVSEGAFQLTVVGDKSIYCGRDMLR